MVSRCITASAGWGCSAGNVHARILPVQIRETHCEGVVIRTIGPRSNAVFGSSSQSVTAPQEQVSILLADSPELIAEPPQSEVAVMLSTLPPIATVPAFDVSRVNPIGWKPAHGPPLHPTGSLSESGLSTVDMRKAHHVSDWTRPGADPALRAGELAAAAASGVVVSVGPNSTELEPFLGSELYGLMTATDRIEGADAHGRELLSIALRRAALRHHSLGARTRQVLTAAGLEPPPLPLVSMLAPTCRPGRLSAVVDAVSAQTYPSVELVVAQHGSGFERSETEAQLERLHCPARAVDVEADRSLGEVLNMALSAASGEMVAKIDDDDLYGPDHLWDLALAAEYSGAALVGKVSEYVYLTETGRMVRRFVGFGERHIDPERLSVAGGAVAMRRDALDAIGGWRAMGVGEDKALARDIATNGGSVYRTHGAGYVLMRHSAGHTWEVDDSYFLEQAHETCEGCDLQFAGMN